MNSQMEAEKKLLTPDEAARLLERVPPYQRNRRAQLVSRYAKMMRDGDWVDYSSMIAISDDGELIDGQHRLAAQVESGATVGYVVLSGAPRRIYEVIDSGARRTLADRAGTSIAKTSMALSCVLWESGAPISLCISGTASGKTKYASDTDVIRYVEKHGNLIERLFRGFEVARKRCPVITTKPYAVFALSASLLYGPGTVEAFLSELADWNTHCPQAKAAVAALTGERFKARGRDSERVFAVLARAIDQYVDGFVPSMPTKSNFTKAIAEKYRNKPKESV